MDFSAISALSLAGMDVERTRLDVAAVNLANAHTTRTPDGGPFRPLGVSVSYRVPQAFAGWLGAQANVLATQSATVVEQNAPPRMVLEPGHPDADAKGFVAYPAVNSVTEMVNVMNAVRSYEANVMALNGAKAMAMKALEIGGGS